MRLPYVHKWNEFWQWQSESNFRILCFFQTKITYTIILLRNLILASHLSFPLSQFTKIISKFLNCNEFCTNEGRGNTQKELSLASKTSLEVEKLNNSEILKPTRLCQWGLLFRFSVLDEIYCGFAVSAIFCAVLRFLIGPYAPLLKVSVSVSIKTKQNIFDHTKVFVSFTPEGTLFDTFSPIFHTKRPKTLMEMTVYDCRLGPVSRKPR